MRHRPLLAAVAAGLLLVACSDTEDSTPVVTDLPSLPSDGTDPGAASSTSTTAGASPTTSAAPAAPSTTSTPPPTTAALPASPAQSFVEPGPYLAGVTTLEVGDREAEVWYPVDAGDVEGSTTEVFDTLSVFPESLQALIPAELSGLIDTGAFRDVPVSLDAPFPVVVYSHGFGGYRQAATRYATHLASWGFVVVSTDHLERGIAAQATGQLRTVPGRDVLDVEQSLAALAASAIGPAADLEHVAITGHSAGAGTAVRAARDLDSIDSFISISGSAPVVLDGGDEVGLVAAQIRGDATEHRIRIVSAGNGTLTAAVDGAPRQTVTLGERAEPITLTTDGGTVVLQRAESGPLRPGTVTARRVVAAKPGVVVLADGDSVVDPASSRQVYGLLGAPRYLVEIAGAGHNSFTDSCARIRELGGLQSLVELIGADQVERAENGCTDQFIDPALAIDILDHYSVAFLRTTLGVANDSATLAVDITPDIGGVTLGDLRHDD